MDAAARVKAAWARIDARVAAGRLRPPAGAGLLAAAAHLPRSLQALYAAHDGGETTEILGLGRIHWWPLARVSEEPFAESDDRKLAVFAVPMDVLERADSLEDYEGFEDVEEEPDAVLAIDTKTEEVVYLGRKGSIDIFAKDLGAALEKVAKALEAPKPTPREPPSNRAPGVAELVAMLIEKKIIELREGATAAEIAALFLAALKTEDEKKRRRAVLAVFDAPLVDEVFATDDELKIIARKIARDLA